MADQIKTNNKNIKDLQKKVDSSSDTITKLKEQIKALQQKVDALSNSIKVEDNEVMIFLKSIKMENHYKKLVKNGFKTLDSLNYISESNLKSIGISMAESNKLLFEIKNSKNNNNNNNKRSMIGETDTLY